MLQTFFILLKKSLFGFALLSLSITVCAQTTDSTSQKTKQKMKMALGLQVGSNALAGADLALNVAKFLNVRVGYNFLAAKKGDYKPDLSTFGLDYPEINEVVNMAIETDLSNANLILEFLPTKKQRIRLQTGAAMFTNAKMNGTISTTASIRKDGWEITPQDIGTLSINATPKNKVAPYFGLGIGRTIPKKRVGFSIDMGVYYTGSFQFTVVGTDLLSDNAHNGDILTRNLAPYKWFPVGNARLSFRLN